MIVFPNAKINIGLNVVAKRADGYHDIETVFYPVLLQDALEISLMRPLDPALLRKRLEAGLLVQPDDVFLPYHGLFRKKEDIPCCSLEMTGNTFPFSAADNLVVKAYLLLQQDFDLPSIDIKLHKHIPSGAGLGGGSSDCAFMITLLNRRFNLRMRDSMMERYAARLGSDCAFFISNIPSLATLFFWSSPRSLSALPKLMPRLLPNVLRFRLRRRSNAPLQSGRSASLMTLRPRSLPSIRSWPISSKKSTQWVPSMLQCPAPAQPSTVSSVNHLTILQTCSLACSLASEKCE